MEDLKNKRLKGVRTVFVDLDDTIWNFTENSKLALRHVFDEFAISRWVDYATFEKIYMVKNKELWELYHHGLIEKSFLLTERYRYTLEQIGAEGDIVALGRKIDAAYLDFLADLPGLHDGAMELLEYLVERYDVNVLSNGFAHVQSRKLKAGGVAQYIHQIVLSDECGITKPQRGIFDFALQKCGADAATTVMIGDNYDADICGAHDAGWRTVFYNFRGSSVDDSVADAEVSELLDVEQIL